MDSLSTRQLNRAVHEAAAAAHIEKRVTTHTLRHYFSWPTMSSSELDPKNGFGNLALHSMKSSANTRHSFPVS
jgi:integrase/recombinase XerD